MDDKYNLKGLITVKDIQKKLKYPNAAKDSQGRLRVGAAIGATGDFLERAQELAEAKVDVLAIDSAHGHSTKVLEAVRLVKSKLPEIDLLAGNVATFDGASSKRSATGNPLGPFGTSGRTAHIRCVLRPGLRWPRPMSASGWRPC